MKLEFDVDHYIEKIKHTNSYFHTFINKETLAVGVLILSPGEKDTQEPHANDEVYLVLEGNGFLKINNRSYPVSKNKLYFVAKNTPHFFYGNSKNLVVLYFFGGSDS